MRFKYLKIKKSLQAIEKLHHNHVLMRFHLAAILNLQ